MAQSWSGVLGESLFSPVQSSGVLAEAVAQKISDAVSMGLISDGEQLPTETELAAQLGVSTVTLRGALLILRQQGLVETRRGRKGGSFVRAPEQVSTAVQTSARLQAMTPAYLRELGDELFAISGVTALLAARRYEERNLGRLYELVTQLEQTDSIGEAARLDTQFHVEVAVASQSERLTRRLVTLQAEYVDMLWLPDTTLDQLECAAAHRAITDAIRAEDAETARSLAERHSSDNTHALIDLRVGMLS